MADIRVINGIGKGKVLATPSGDVPTRTFILPLTMQGGYTESWSEESFIKRLISLDFTTRRITKAQFAVDGFGSWRFNYTGIPKDNAFIQDCVAMKNIRSQYSFTLIPKYEPLIGLPDRMFEVNLIECVLTFQTGDSIHSPGTFGVELLFETTENQQVSVGIATGILPGGGSYNAPFEGGM